MKLATLKVDVLTSSAQVHDGRLIVVSQDNRKGVPIPGDRYPSLLSALDDWTNAAPVLTALSADLAQGRATPVIDLSQANFRAPLPRAYAWLDGSAFIQHVILVRQARGAELPEDLYTIPLMYQGASDNLLGPNDPIPLGDESWGMDFEGEVAVVVDEVPRGVTPAAAAQHVKLLLLMNDVSLRNLIPREMATGFGFFHGKPNSSFGPFAVTPDELGTAWRDGRVHLPLEVRLNGAQCGQANAGEMHFSFYDLIAHAAKTRPLSAGTIIGSGTVSNKDESAGVSCLAEKRMLEKIKTGTSTTPFMKVGDRIEMDMKLNQTSIFGRIDQKIARA